IKPGAADLLAYLTQHDIPVGLATSSDRRDAEAHLERAGMLPHFKAMVTGEQVKQGKPDPEIYLTAAAALAVDPKDCLALEDSFSGVRSARGAGMQCLMIPDLIQPTTEIRALASGVLDSLDEVLQHLRLERGR
ncbi:MAG: HAD family hydrolase, partial [Gemmataceae bacterium]